MSSSLRVKPQPVQAQRQKSFAFTDNNGSTSYAFFPTDATTMDIAKAIYKDSGAACWPLTIDGVPLAEFDFDKAEDIIHNVEWSPTQGKIIEKYKKALEKAIEEAQTTHEATPVMSNVPQPNSGPARGVDAEQAKNVQAATPAEEAGWKTAHGSKRNHGARNENGAPVAAAVAQQNQAPSAKTQATTTATGGPARNAVPSKAEVGSKATPAAVPKPAENPWVEKGKSTSKVEPADDWPTEEAANNTKFWLDSNGNWTTDQEQALESSPALTLTDVSGDEDEMPFPGEEIDVSELEDGDKAKKDIDLDSPREAFSERRAAEIETLFSDLIASWAKKYSGENGRRLWG